jgi:4-amino-4-deoxy-L-arabinose transferase-like glycosyltransferase
MHGRFSPTLLAVLGAGLLFLTRLDAPLLEPQEARYAEIPRQMLAEDSWMTPVLHGQPYLDKPPLLYWLVMLSYQLFGVHDWAARLVPGLAGVFTVLLTFLWGRRVAGERAGLCGAMVLCLSARYVYLGRMLTFDTLLTLWVTAALAAAHIGLSGGERRWWLLCGAACGLGMLTKGPVALVLVGVPVLAMLLLARRSVRPALLALPAMLLVAGPWFAYMMLHHTDFVHHFFWEHHVVRFLTPFDHEEPFWFHLPGLLLGMLPWTFLLPGLIRHTRHRLTPALGFLMLSASWGLLFFSLSGCKRAVYILPAFPPLALAIGYYLDVAAPWSLRVTTRCAAATFALLFAGVLFLLPMYNERFALKSSVQQYEDVKTAVACYPRSWDSVSFYLQRRDVGIYSTEQKAQLLDSLRRQQKTLLFVRSGKVAEELLSELPASLSFTLDRKVGSVLIGWVCQREHEDNHAGLK